MGEALSYLAFFVLGVIIGCFLTIALKHGKDTIIARWKTTTIEKTKK